MKLKYISWLPAFLLMVIIFGFSSKPADNSNDSSLTIAQSILTVYENITNIQYQEEVRVSLMDMINHVVRKGAHFSEYAVLAVAVAFHLLVWKKKRLWLLLMPIMISTFYAITDEIHQTFIPGRSGQITDVLLDASGAATGSLLFFLFVAMVVKIKGKSGKAATASR
jgi:VanZ family protein